MKKYYIAYGSNLNIQQMRLRCPRATIVGTSVLRDYELLFKGSKTGSYLTIEKKKGGRVPVAIWEISEIDEFVLDHYEGYPNFYYKAEIILPVKDIRTGKTHNYGCFVYIMHEERAMGIPAPEYVEACLAGYKSFGFDKKYIEQAQMRAAEVVS